QRRIGRGRIRALSRQGYGVYARERGLIGCLADPGSIPGASTPERLSFPLVTLTGASRLHDVSKNLPGGGYFRPLVEQSDRRVARLRGQVHVSHRGGEVLVA